MSASAAELEEKIRSLFEDADTDGSGSLDVVEFKKFVNRLDVSLGLNLSEVQTRKLLTSADQNDDGDISYAEFIPVATKIISDENLQKKRKAQEAVDAAKVFLVHGLTKDQLHMELRRIFTQADADKTGFLSRKQFRDALRVTGLGISKEEANYMLQSVDVDSNGFIDFNEFIPKGFDLLAQLVADRLLVLYANEEQTRHFLYEMFEEADHVGDGVLPRDQIKLILADADLGFTDVQLEEMVNECPVVEGGAGVGLNYKAGIGGMARLAIKYLQAATDDSGNDSGGPAGDSFAELTADLSAVVSRSDFIARTAKVLGADGASASASAFQAAMRTAAPMMTEDDAAVAAEVALTGGGDSVNWTDVVLGECFDAWMKRGSVL